MREVLEETTLPGEYEARVIQFTDEYAQEKAAGLGCTVEYSDDFTLQLDIDSDEAFCTYCEQMTLLEDLGIVETTGLAELRYSRSGNRHVTLKLTKPLCIETRILLQALLGSDRKRELLAYAGRLKGQKNPVVLFRPIKETPFSLDEIPF